MSLMIKKIFVLSILFLFFLSAEAVSAEKEDFQFKKQQEIQQVKPKKPVKIKLKRSNEGKYAWELAGDDVDEIVNADRKLRRLLKTE